MVAEYYCKFQQMILGKKLQILPIDHRKKKITKFIKWSLKKLWHSINHEALSHKFLQFFTKFGNFLLHRDKKFFMNDFLPAKIFSNDFLPPLSLMKIVGLFVLPHLCYTLASIVTFILLLKIRMGGWSVLNLLNLQIHKVSKFIVFRSNGFYNLLKNLLITIKNLKISLCGSKYIKKKKKEDYTYVKSSEVQQ